MLSWVQTIMASTSPNTGILVTRSFVSLLPSPFSLLPSPFSLLPSPFSLLPPSSFFSPQLAMLGDMSDMSTSEEEGEGEGGEEEDGILTIVDDIDLDLDLDDTITNRLNIAMADLEKKLRKILRAAEAEGIRLEESFEHFDKVNRDILPYYITPRYTIYDIRYTMYDIGREHYKTRF